jgi:hypothetical protein
MDIFHVCDTLGLDAIDDGPFCPAGYPDACIMVQSVGT